MGCLTSCCKSPPTESEDSDVSVPPSGLPQFDKPQPSPQSQPPPDYPHNEQQLLIPPVVPTPPLVDPAEKAPSITLVPEIPIDSTLATKDKILTFYTTKGSVKAPTQVILSVTPAQQGNGTTYTPLAWKVLRFAANDDVQVPVTWTSSSAFATGGQTELVCHSVEKSQSVILRNVGQNAVWNSLQLGEPGLVTARNETSVPRTFTLGALNDADEFQGFVRFPATPPNGFIQTAPATILQAYVVATAGYIGQTLSDADLANVIKRADGTPFRLDLKDLTKDASIRLSRNNSGHFILGE